MNYTTYGFAIREWLFGKGTIFAICASAKTLQKLSPSYTVMTQWGQDSPCLHWISQLRLHIHKGFD